MQQIPGTCEELSMVAIALTCALKMELQTYDAVQHKSGNLLREASNIIVATHNSVPVFKGQKLYSCSLLRSLFLIFSLLKVPKYLNRSLVIKATA